MKTTEEIYEICNRNNIHCLIRNNLKVDATRCSDKKYFINVHDSNEERTSIYRGYVDSIKEASDEIYEEVVMYIFAKNDPLSKKREEGD